MALSLRSNTIFGPQAKLSQAIDDFRKSLNDAQRREYHKFVEASRPSVADVINVIQAVDIRMKERTLHCFSIRMDGFLRIVQNFASAGDVIVGSSQNMIAGGIWGVVKLSLQVFSNATSFLEKFSELLMRIYTESHLQQSLIESYPPSAELRKASCEYLITVVQLFTKALQLFNKSKPSRLLSTGLWGDSGELLKFEERFRNHARELRLLLDTLNRQTDIELAQGVKHVTANQDFRLKRSQEKARHRFLEACSTHDTRATRVRLKKKGFTQWLFELPEYETWVQAPHSCVLWCTGIIGSGKSVLVANLYQQLSSIAKSPAMIAYFACEHDRPTTLEYRNIIGTLGKQLFDAICMVPPEDLTNAASDTISSDRVEEMILKLPPAKGPYYILIDGIDDCRLESEILALAWYLNNLIKTSDSCFRIYLSTRPDLPQRLESILKPHYNVSMRSGYRELQPFVHTQLTLRSESGELALTDPEDLQRIEEKLVSNGEGMFLWVALQIKIICVQARETDINQVLNELPQSLPETYDRILRKIHEEIKAPIRKQLYEFVAAAKRPMTLDELAEGLSVTPGDIEWSRASVVKDVRKAVLSGGSLIEIDEEQLTVHFAHPTVKQHLMSSLSAELQEYRIQEDLADRRLGEVCVTYLNFNKFENQLKTHAKPRPPPPSVGVKSIVGSDIRNSKYGRPLMWIAPRTETSVEFDVVGQLAKYLPTKSTPFEDDSLLGYARAYWLRHSVRFREDIAAYKLWTHLISGSVSIVELPWAPEIWYHLKPKVVEWAFSNSHTALLRELILKSADFSLVFPYSRGTPSAVFFGSFILSHFTTIPPDLHGALLVGAARADNLPMLRILVQDLEVSVDSPHAGEFRTALQAACSRGYLEMVRVLLSWKADVNSPSGKQGSALSVACACGDKAGSVPEAVVSLLLQHGADIHDSDGALGTPLLAAVSANNDAVVNLLLQAGAGNDINTVAGDFGSPLLYAAGSGSLDRVQRLIELGADVNVTDEQCAATPLFLACWAAKFEVVKILVENGADINYANGKRLDQTILQAAATSGSIELVEFLIKNGADPNEIKDGHWGSPLNAAVNVNNKEMVQYLLDHGADPNSKCGTYGPALRIAAGNGNKAITQLLLDYGADPFLTVFPDETATWAAKLHGHKDIVPVIQAAVDRLLSKTNTDTDVGLSEKDQQEPET